MTRFELKKKKVKIHIYSLNEMSSFMRFVLCAWPSKAFCTKFFSTTSSLPTFCWTCSVDFPPLGRQPASSRVFQNYPVFFIAHPLGKKLIHTKCQPCLKDLWVSKHLAGHPRGLTLAVSGGYDGGLKKIQWVPALGLHPLWWDCFRCPFVRGNLMDEAGIMVLEWFSLDYAVVG